MGSITFSDRPYAIQLSGRHSRAKALELAARPDLPPRVYLRRELRRGRPWFVLVHSLYGNLVEAQAALVRVPPEVRALSPRVRVLPPETRLEVLTRPPGP